MSRLSACTLTALFITTAIAADPAVDRFGDPLPPFAVARLGTMRYRSERPLSHPIVLPGGRQVVFADVDAVVVMDLDTGKTSHRITRVIKGDKRTNPVTALAVAPDGRTLAVGCRDIGTDGKAMAFWLGDVSGRVIREFPGRDRPVDGLAFLADGRQVAALDEAGSVSVWDAATGAKVCELTAPDRKLFSLAVSADGRFIAAGGEVEAGAAAVYVWDAATGRLRHTLAGHSAVVRVVAFTPDGRTLASGGATVRLWDVATGRELRQMHGHARKHGDTDHFIRSLAVSPDGRTVASASTDGTVRTWAVATGQPVDDVAVTVSEAHALAFRDGRTLLVGSGYRLFLRDTVAHAFTNDYGSRYGMYFVNFTADGRQVVTGDGDVAVRTWDAADGRLLSQTRHPRNVMCPMVAPGGQLIALTDGDADQMTAYIGDVATGRIVHRLPDKDQMPTSFSANGRRFATLRTYVHEEIREHRLTVWNVATGARVNQINLGGTYQSLAMAGDGRSVFVAQNENPHRLQRWDVIAGRAVQEYVFPENMAARSIAASPGGRRLAVICDTGPLRMFDAVTGRECWQTDQKDEIHNETGVAFSPDGVWLATESFERGFAIHLLDARTGKIAATLRGHASNLGQLAFSADGRRLVSTCTDGTALIWDVEAATGRKAVGVLDAARQTELWADLAGDDGLGAHAVDCLQASPADAVTFLKAKLRPAVAVPVDRVAPLVARLDAAAFAVREQAQRDLAALGPGAEPAVRAARATAPAEGQRRIDAVLATWDGELRRASRAVEVLEYVATPEARKLLGELAAGDPPARLTTEAKAALDRLVARASN